MSKKINFECSECGRQLTVDSAHAGRSGKCPCGARLKVPAIKAEGPIARLPGFQMATRDIDLEGKLICPGDLPTGYSGAQVRLKASAMFDDLPAHDYVIHQQLQAGPERAGGVNVFQYKNAEVCETAFQKVVAGMGTYAMPDATIGTACFYTCSKTEFRKMGVNIADMSGGDVSFVRDCFLVHIRMTRSDSAEDYLTYAKRLDKRLKETEW